MDRQENGNHFKNTKDRITLIYFLVFVVSVCFSGFSCKTKKRQIHTITKDLTRLLYEPSTLKIGNFQNKLANQGSSSDPLPYHWKKNPGRYSKLSSVEKWWNTQITFNTDTNLFINDSKDSILLPASDQDQSSVQFSLPSQKYNLYLSIGFLPILQNDKPQGKFRILTDAKVVFEMDAGEIAQEVWKQIRLDLEVRNELKFEWTSKNSIVALGNPILSEKKESNSPNIVLIVIDSARKDFFPSYGFPYAITPNISKLAEESVIFENPFSNGNWTKPSMISFFHSEYSSNLGIHNLWFATLPNHKKVFYKKNSPSLTEVLRQNSFYTETIMNNVFLLDYTTVGVDIGFHSSYQVGKDIDDSEELTKQAVEFLDTHREDLFFLHWNLNTPHGGYAPPPEMMEAVRKIIPDKEFNSYPAPIRRYIGELYYTDALIGKFIHKLKQLNLYDDTVILITGDHGELFDERHDYHYRFILQGIYGHGETHYDEEINVPYIIKTSKNLHPTASKSLVKGQQSLLSLLPTLLGLANLPKETPIRKGVDYSTCLFSEEECPQEKIIFTEGRMSESIRTLDYKYIRRYQGYTSVSKTLNGARHSMPEELYDLKSDPKEYKNLAVLNEGKNLLLNARKDLENGNFLTKNQFIIFLPDCGSASNLYKISLSIPAGIYKLELPAGFLASKDQLRSTNISGYRTDQSTLIKIQTVNPEPTIKANFNCNGKTLNYRVGKWGIESNSSILSKENAVILSAREPNGFRKSNLPWIYNDARLSGEYESETEAIMGQEVRKILESWGYIHE